MKKTVEELFDLSGKTALVVGGASGLGRAMAEALNGAGAAVVIADLNATDGEDFRSLRVDVRKQDDVEKMVEKAVEILGCIDVLVDSAGLTITGTPMMDFDEDKWDKIIDVNLKGMFFVNQAVGRQMIKQKSGRIINIGSMSSVIINQNSYGSSGVYCTSKGGVINLTKAFASDLAPFGITVNAISPGYMRTPLSASFWENEEDCAEKCSKIPLGRPGEPDELMGIVIYLASNASSYMTGSNILIDGGYTIW